MLYVVLVLCVSLVIWKWLKRQDPGEPPVLSGQYPLVGHSLLLMGDSIDMFNFVKQTSVEGIEMGGVIKMYLGPRMLYGIMDPDDSLTVCTECIQKHYIYDFAKPLFANGILNADVETWKKHRRLLNPAFSQQVLDGFIEIFNTQAQSLVEQFDNKVGKPFDHEACLRINNLETICATSFGAKPEEYGSLQQEYLPLLEEVLHIFNVRMQKFWYHNDFLYKFSSLKKRQDEIVERLDKFSNSIVQKKKSELKNGAYSDNTAGKLKPFIDLIVELAKDNPSLTDFQIRGETSTVIAGGHDTSASGLTFALTLLGSHPHVQEKAYKEILEVLGDSNRCVNKEDLSKLVYIEAIVKEALRLYPSVPLIARQLDKDIKLKNYTLKAGHGCIVSLYGIQRHPMWGPDANDFRPDRWFEKDSLPDTKYFAAFGQGRRSCIGKAYAMMSMKIILAHVLRRFTISSDVSKMTVKMDTMIRPVDGFHITLERRHE